MALEKDALNRQKYFRSHACINQRLFPIITLKQYEINLTIAWRLMYTDKDHLIQWEKFLCSS